MFKLHALCVLLAGIECLVKSAKNEEPTCFSRWDHEYKTMRQMLLIEGKLEELENKITQHNGITQRMTTALLHRDKHLSTLTRWGRNVCPNSSTLIYKGYTAGKHYNDLGSGSDTICLPEDPTWSNFTDGNDINRGRVYGTEIDINEPSNVFPYSVNDQDVPCAVCLVERSTVLMIPGRSNCYEGWTLEYNGYIAAAYYSHTGPHNHICVDFQPDFIPKGGSNDNQHILYLIEAQCGSLPCPPYVQGRELACVVCSK